MSLKDAKDIPSNASQAVKSLKGLFAGLAAAYVIAIPIHDIWTGESLLGKTWNSTVVNLAEDSKACEEGPLRHAGFICNRRGDGKGLETLVPDFLK